MSLSEISMVKGDIMDMDHYYAKNCSEDMFRQLYRGYEARLRQNRLLDFDDMLVMCYELFKERKRYPVRMAGQVQVHINR